ncbi:MAG: nucleoside recognition domain-containing protein [Ignavibacteria bacterium]|nr:MAG: nucleoside recognition domain-containing protein [Ignavibacteria bacterium]KAF0158659.1 MAG: nucleoside recognition domain-containing protein [Ignavibacteria bacterium]
MLNYIWAALLGLGIFTAVVMDIFDSSTDKFQNYKPLSVVVETSDSNLKEENEAAITVDSKNFSRFYKSYAEKISQKAKLTYNSAEGYYSVYINVDGSTPEVWKKMASASGKEDDLTAKLWLGKQLKPGKYSAWIVFESVSMLKMKFVTNAAIEYAGKAVNIALGLVGIMALWLGIMKIAEQAGLINIIARVFRPLTKFLFPSVPHDHPAIGSIVMNISANMLGLGNAATPFGLKAMEELEKLNPKKGTATNAMITFLGINTAGLTLIPATAIAVRAASGSSDPAIIIGTSIFGAGCATIAAIIATKLLEKFPMTFSEFISLVKSSWKILATLFLFASSVVFLVFSGAVSSLGDTETIKSIIQLIAVLAIPFIITSFVAYGFLKKVKVYEVFVEGAKEGFNVALRIIPYLVAMLVAIGIFRAGGAMDFLIMIISPATSLIGFPAEALPMALMRPLSGSGAIGIMTETIAVHGADSFLGILVSTLNGSSETTFYVLALYFGSVGISKTRHAVSVGLIGDIAGALGALFIVKLLFGSL